MRDSDRHKVYRAEAQVQSLMRTPGIPIQIVGTSVITPDERKFGRVEDVQTYVDRVLDHIGCDRPVKVRVRRGTNAAHYEPLGSVIAVPNKTDWALREMVILHEIAHHLNNDGSDCASHGPEFRSLFCGLLEDVLAPEARFMMQIAYWDHGLTA